MEKLISLKEKLTKIISITENINNNKISLIEKDILLQHIRELYTDANELNIIDINNKEFIQEKPKQNIISEPEIISEKKIETIIEEKYITTTENISEERIKESEIIIENIKHIDSIEFLDEPHEIMDDATEPEEEVKITEFIKEEVIIEKITIDKTPESINKEVKNKENYKVEIEQASLFSNNNFTIETKKTIGEQLKTNNTSLNDILAQNKQQQDISSIMNLKPVADIKSAIGIGDRFLYIRELFNGNSETFEETISHLNSLTNFEEATIFLKGKFQWDITQDSVISFVNTVKRRYL